MRKQIGVLGGSKENLPADTRKAQQMLQAAEEVGRLLAQADCIVFTGGMDGIMEAVSNGAKLAGGMTVGTPGKDRGACNPFVDVEVCTPINTGDFIFAGLLSCDALIVFPGGAGTWAELCIAYRYRKPMIIFQGFDERFDALVGRSLDISAKMVFQGSSNPAECVSVLLQQL